MSFVVGVLYRARLTGESLYWLGSSFNSSEQSDEFISLTMVGF